MYMYIYIHIHTYIHIYDKDWIYCVIINKCSCNRGVLHEYTHTHVCVYIYIYIYTYTHTCVCVCVCVCVNVMEMIWMSIGRLHVWINTVIHMGCLNFHITEFIIVLCRDVHFMWAEVEWYIAVNVKITPLNLSANYTSSHRRKLHFFLN